MCYFLNNRSFSKNHKCLSYSSILLILFRFNINYSVNDDDGSLVFKKKCDIQQFLGNTHTHTLEKYATNISKYKQKEKYYFSECYEKIRH